MLPMKTIRPGLSDDMMGDAGSVRLMEEKRLGAEH